MAFKTSYIQGETIDATVTADNAVAAALVVYTGADTTAANAAIAAAAGNAKQSLTVGEISMTDKTAEELLALRSALSSSSDFRRFPMALDAAAGAFAVHAPTDDLFGSYSYAVLVTRADGSTESVEAGAFAVVGAASKAASRGAFKTILTRF